MQAIKTRPRGPTITQRLQQHERLIRNMAKKLTVRCPQHRQDCEQEARICLWQIRMGGARNPEHYMARAMKNAMINHLRKQTALERADSRYWLAIDDRGKWI